MIITLEEHVTTSTRTVHLIDGPTIASDRSAGKRRDFQVNKVTITSTSLGGTTIMCWGMTKLSGMDIGIKKTYNGLKDLPKWLDTLVGKP